MFARQPILRSSLGSRRVDLASRPPKRASRRREAREHPIPLYAEERLEFELRPAVAWTDDRQDYSENRDISLGALSPDAVLVVVHAERGDKIRLISARKANRHEGKLYHGYFTQAQKGI